MATTALAVPQGLGADIEKVLIGGDLKDLNPDQRLRYYNAVCTSIGLNPLTRPFEYIVLNNKLQLYARKDCTEQLRKINGVSITRVDPKQIGDLIVVVAEATARDGRTDSSTGAVNILQPERIKDYQGNWMTNPKAGKQITGEDLANAMMKAETKAKRRVTLSLCGLGMLDETEIQTLREQGVAAEPQGNTWTAPQKSEPAHASQEPGMYDANPSGNDYGKPQPISDGEPDIRPKSQRGNPTQPSLQTAGTKTATTNPTTTGGTATTVQGEVVGAEPSITVPQGKRFFAIAKSAGLSDEQVKQRLASIGLHCHRDSIPKSRYNASIDAIDPEYRFHTRS